MRLFPVHRHGGFYVKRGALVCRSEVTSSRASLVVSLQVLKLKMTFPFLRLCLFKHAETVINVLGYQGSAFDKDTIVQMC